ncbi:cupin domain-containing protein [Chloroflexota bacterium]
MPKVINPQELEGYSPPGHGGVINKQMVDKNTGSLKIKVAMGRQAPGGITEMHSHDSSEQLHFVLKGEVTITGPDGNFKITEGMAVLTPPGEAHGMMNETDQDNHYLVVSA